MLPILRLSEAVIVDLAEVRDVGLEHLEAARLALANLGDAAAEPALRRTLEPIVGKSHVEAVMRLLLNLRPGFDLGNAEEAKQVIEAVTKSLSSLPSSRRWTPEQLKAWSDVAPVLTQLLVLPCLHTLAKGTSLKLEREHILTGLRIITDLRPVFDDGSQADTKIAAATIIHTLRLRYFSTGRTEELFLAVDESDLEELTTACERALKKRNALREQLKSMSLLLLDSEGQAQ